MELSEIFLLAWAGIATALAVMFRNEAIKAHYVLVKSMILLKDIAEGKAKVNLTNNELKIERVGE